MLPDNGKELALQQRNAHTRVLYWMMAYALLSESATTASGRGSITSP